MGDNFLSQDEINALLAGNNDDSSNEDTAKQDGANEEETITETDKDLLGEIGNISMGSASTALYQLINQKVNITTPVVSVTTLGEIKKNFETPNIVLDIKYINGIVGRNILIIKIDDGLVISNLMMGGDGTIGDHKELSEIEISAVSEAMNQMIGSAATSMATMFGRKVDISPPTSKVVTSQDEPLSDAIADDEKIVKVSFRMTIGDIVDSNIMQIFPIKTAKNIVAIMTGTEVKEEPQESQKISEKPAETAPQMQQPAPAATSAPAMEQQPAPAMQQQMQMPQQQVPMQQQMPQQQAVYGNPAMQMQPQQPVEVHQASFAPLNQAQNVVPPIKNIDLILDVPLNISVVLGRAKKSIQDILDLGSGSLIELDKLAEEPVEILVNGKTIAEGEVVVVDENFGVRITNIVDTAERVKSLK